MWPDPDAGATLRVAADRPRDRGLADTIDDGETGFLFSDLTGEGLFAACRRAFEAFADADVLAEMRRVAMARSFHWSDAATEYEALYRRLLGSPAAEARPQVTPKRRQVKEIATALPVAA